MWFRWAQPARTWAFATPPHGFKPRWHCSMPHDKATWEAKRFYDYCRPITAIRYLFRGKTIRAWGGAGSDQFGYFYMQRKPLAADPHEEVLGLLLSWNTFRDDALDAGLELGKKVGTNAFQKAQAYWTGTV